MITKKEYCDINYGTTSHDFFFVTLFFLSTAGMRRFLLLLTVSDGNIAGGKLSTANTVGSSVAVPRLRRWALDSNIALAAFLYNTHVHKVMVPRRK